MDNKVAFEIEPSTVGRFALGGAVTGASTAAILNLLRLVNDLRNTKEEAKAPSATDANTIVLTLPRRKTAEDCASNSNAPTKVKKVNKPKVSLTTGPKNQLRYNTGEFGAKTAGTGWPTLTVASLAALGSGAAGAALVNKIYEKRREQELENELTAVQQEYMDSLQSGKAAESIAAIFDVPLGKEAGDSGFSLFNTPLAAAALLTVLGTGGTAYVTKRILDEKLRDAQSKGLDLPKVKRIIFNTAGAETPTKEGETECTEEDIDCIKAAFGVMLDRVSPSTTILEVPYVKEAMVKANTSVPKLFKLAGDMDNLMAYMQQSPDLRNLIQRASLEKHPILKHFKWGLKIPGIRGMADKKLYAGLTEALGPKQPVAPPAPAVAGNLRTPLDDDPMFDLKRAFVTPGSVMSSLIGSRMADAGNQEALTEAIIRANEAAKAKTTATPETVTEDIALEAGDPEAEAYLAENKDRILELLKQMASKGKL